MTAPSAYDQTSMAGAFKQRYGSKPVQFLPLETKLRNATEFDSKNREGDKFNVMVTLTHSGGGTYAGSSLVRTAYDTNAAIPAASANAYVQATEYLHTEYVAYGAAFAAQGNDEASFVDSQEYAVKNAVQGAAKRLESKFWYGGSPTADQAVKVCQGAGIGCLDAHSGSSTTRVYTISAATWSSVWLGAENNQIDAVNITGAGTGTFSSLAVINTNAALTVTKIDAVNRKVTVSGNATDLTNIDAVGDTNVVFYWRGSFGQTGLGVHQILGAKPLASTLFGIALGTYSFWDPVAIDEGGAPLSFNMVMAACDSLAARGFAGKTNAYVSISQWTDIMTDTDAARRVDYSYRSGKVERGSEGVMFHGQTGPIELIPHAYIKPGFYYVLGMDNWSRKGSTEITFDLPNGMPMWWNLPTNAGYGLRALAVEEMFCSKPSHNVMGYNVSPTHVIA